MNDYIMAFHSECGNGAFWVMPDALTRAYKDVALSEHVLHLDGSPIEPNSECKCDSCSRPIVALNKRWIMFSRPSFES